MVLRGARGECLDYTESGRPQGSQLKLGWEKKWWQKERFGRSKKLEEDRIKIIIIKGQNCSEWVKKRSKGAKIGSKVI